MAVAPFTLALSYDRLVTVNLDMATPIYELVEELCDTHGLPLTDERGRPLAYTLFAGGDRYPLSREQTLEQAQVTVDTRLTLAQIAYPWWVAAPKQQANALQWPQPGLVALLLGLIAISLILVLPTLRRGFLQQPASSSIEPSPRVTEEATATLVPLAAALTPATARATATIVPIESATPDISPTAVLPELEVQGVRAGYSAISPRLFKTLGGVPRAYLWQEAELKQPVPAPEGDVLLSNGDRVGVVERRTNLLHVEVRTNQADTNDPRVLGLRGWVPAWLIENTNVPPTPTSEPSVATSQLRFKLENENDTRTCLSVGIRGTSTGGWKLRINGLNVTPANFDGAGNARICGLAERQEVTFDVLNASGRIMPGGRGIPTRGGSIMIAEWK
jgi:hypothetical protein